MELVKMKSVGNSIVIKDIKNLMKKHSIATSFVGQ